MVNWPAGMATMSLPHLVFTTELVRGWQKAPSEGLHPVEIDRSQNGTAEANVGSIFNFRCDEVGMFDGTE